MRLRRGEPMWPALTLERIARRDGLHCLHCGAVYCLSVQHRHVRGMGGSNDRERPSNGIILCVALNVAIGQDADVAAWAESYGWALTGDQPPAERPVTDATSGIVWLLDDEWGRREVA